MDLTHTAEEEPEAHGISTPVNRKYRVEPKLVLSHVLTELVYVAFDR
jgi:hypothetical protein